MLLLKSQEKLLLLQKELEKCIPHSLKVYGSVLKIQEGNPFLQEILVDTWPDFNVVLARPQNKQGESSNDDTYRNSYAYFFKDPKSVSESFMEAIDWTQAFEVQGLQCCLGEMLLDAARRRKTRTEMTTLKTFCQEKGTCFSLPKLSGKQMPHMSSLTIPAAEFVDKTWAFGGNTGSLCYVQTCIKSSPSCCIVNDKGHPISWVLTDQYGAIRMAYTLPEHRGQGYAKCVVSSLSKVLQQDVRPVYCHVDEDNEPSKALFNSLGFVEATELLWFHSTPTGNPQR